MLQFTPFEPEHLALVAVQSQQVEEEAMIALGVGRTIGQHLAFSGWKDGICVVCSGLMPLHPQRAFLWGYLSQDCRSHMLQLTRFVSRVLASYPARRVEATVHPEFAEARRWLLLLGFICEAELEAYDELGRTMLMFKRIRS